MHNDECKIKINVLFEQYLQESSLTDATKKNYCYLWKRYMEEEEREKDIRNYEFVYHDLAINRLVLAMLNQAELNCLIDNVPKEMHAKNYVMLDKKGYYLSVVQQRGLLRFVQASEEYREWYVLILTMSLTGMRSNEICLLKWDDVDFENNMIHLQKHDSRLEGFNIPPIEFARTIPLIFDLKRELLSWRKRKCKKEATSKGFGMVFNNLNEGNITPYGIFCKLQEIRDVYNMQVTHSDQQLVSLSPWVFRKTYYKRLMFSAIITPDVIEALIGRDSIFYRLIQDRINYNEVLSQLEQIEFY